MADDDAKYTVDEVYSDLIKLIYYIANQKCTDAVLMSRDELVGELSLEMFKVFQHYKDKNISKDEMLDVIRRSLHNRIGELKYRYHLTHRAAEAHMGDIDADLDDPDPARRTYNASNIEMIAVMGTSSTNPATLYDSQERVQETRLSLSPDALRILDAILAGDDAIQQQMELVVDRAAAVGRGGTITVRAWHLAAALGLSDSAARKAFKEIKDAYREVCNG